MFASSISIFDKDSLSGIYLLCIDLHRDQRLAFGRFRQGALFDLNAGTYIYLGSARHHTLAARLLRHTRRTGDRPVHQIQFALMSALRKEEMSFSAKPASAKKLHWHIDYLLDSPQAEITGILAVRTDEKLEASLGKWLMTQLETQVMAAGLSASDVPGNTHLMELKQAGWDMICVRMIDEFDLR